MPAGGGGGGGATAPGGGGGAHDVAAPGGGGGTTPYGTIGGAVRELRDRLTTRMRTTATTMPATAMSPISSQGTAGAGAVAGSAGVGPA